MFADFEYKFLKNNGDIDISPEELYKNSEAADTIKIAWLRNIWDF